MQGTPLHSHPFITQFTPHSYSDVIFQILQVSKCPKPNKSINLIDSYKQVLHRDTIDPWTIQGVGTPTPVDLKNECIAFDSPKM